MSLYTLILLWLGIGVALALASAIWSGWRYDPDPGAAAAMAFMWPMFALVAAVIGPFWLAYKLGEAAHDALYRFHQSPQEKSDDDAAR